MDATASSIDIVIFFSNVLVNLIHRTLLEVKRICRKFPDLAIFLSIIPCAEEDDDKEAQA